jgi:hypothetical protein
MPLMPDSSLLKAKHQGFREAAEAAGSKDEAEWDDRIGVGSHPRPPEVLDGGTPGALHPEYFENICVRLESGSNVEGKLDDALNMYRSNNNGKEFQLMHFFIKFKKCKPWWHTLHQMKKVCDNVVDLDAPLATSVG